MLSRVAHDRAHLARALPDPTGGRPVRVLTVDGQRDRAGRTRAPTGRGWSGTSSPSCPLGAVYLGEADGVPYAAVRGERALTVNGRPVDTWTGLREVGADLGDLDAGLLAQAIGILEWHERNRFSPLSGAPTTIERAGWVQRDPATGTEHLPAHRPRRDHARARRRRPGACSAGRRSGRPAGSPSWPASSSRGSRPRPRSPARSPRRSGCGSPTSATSASQPWPFPQSLMLGFVARADGRRRRCALDHDEIEEARWFTRDELRSGDGPAGAAAAGVDRPAHPRPLGRRRVQLTASG